LLAFAIEFHDAANVKHAARVPKLATAAP
jgi:hypothetical protein